MFVAYMHCRASDEGDRAGFVIARDEMRELNELDYELQGTECLWFVPGTTGETG